MYIEAHALLGYCSAVKGVKRLLQPLGREHAALRRDCCRRAHEMLLSLLISVNCTVGLSATEITARECS